MTTGWQPKVVSALRGYTVRRLAADVVAGITVGLVALPLAMAFAISSGVPPQSGLYCAIVAGFLISALGGSRTQIGGPTGAFVVVVASILARHGLNGLLVCTMMAGGFLVVLGATGLGSAVKFIPRPVVVGFTNGIAVLIASTQVKDFFGLQIDTVPGDFVGRVAALAAHFSTVSPAATILASGAVLLIVLFARYVRRVPGAIVALTLGTVLAAVLGLPVETIGSRFGGIPSGLPTFALPALDQTDLGTLISPALTVALLCAIESLLSAVVADRMTGDRHNPNAELIAQGIANIASPLFGGLPATGAIARTATNIRSGATTPVAGMVHALTLLAIIVFAAPLARYVPLAVLAAVLMIVAYNMSEWREVRKIVRLSAADVSVWLITFALTVFADLTVAVEFGMVLAGLLFVRHVSQTTSVSKITADDVRDGQPHVLQDKHIPDYVTVYRIHGPFLFGTTDRLATVADAVEGLAPIVVLRLRNMTAIDATGLQALEELADKLHAVGRTLILCGARPQPAKLLHQARFSRHIGRENICPHINAALRRAQQVYRESAARPEATAAAASEA